MSYILDALKKSDSERRQRQGPTLTSVQQQPYFYQHHRRSWGSLALFGLVLSLGCSAFWLYQLGYLQIALPTQPVKIQKSGVPERVEQGAERAAGGDEKAVAEVPAPVSTSAPLAAIEAKAAVPAALPQADAPMPPLENMRELWQLPAAVRAGIPPLEFSLHVYSTRLDQRSIIINNRMMREGEYVNPELSLNTITPDGVVMKYRNEYFRVSIVDSW